MTNTTGTSIEDQLRSCRPDYERDLELVTKPLVDRRDAVILRAARDLSAYRIAQLTGYSREYVGKILSAHGIDPIGSAGSKRSPGTAKG